MIFKIILLGACVCIMNLILKQYQKPFVMILNICYVVAVMLIVLDSAADTLKNLTDLLSVSSSVNKMFTCLYKCAAICILTKISSDVCKESGNAVVSDMIDLGGRIVLIIIALPFIESIIKTAAAFVT